jgi:hypothetical protein
VANLAVAIITRAVRDGDIRFFKRALFRNLAQGLELSTTTIKRLRLEARKRGRLHKGEL